MASAEKVINFMGRRKLAALFSVVLLAGSIYTLAVNGIKLGLDFTGGTQVEVGFEQSADLEVVRSVIAELGMENAVAVHFGQESDVLIRTQGSLNDAAEKLLTGSLQSVSADAQLLAIERPEKAVGNFSHRLLVSGINDLPQYQSDIFPATHFANVEISPQGDQWQVLIQNTLDKAFIETLIDELSVALSNPAELRRSEFIGSQVGDELWNDGGLGMLFALAVVMGYVALRFQFKFSVGAVAALVHDVIIVLGFFSLLQLDFDLTVLAAVLAVIGYSLNDTIVVSDRIRENFRTVRKGTPTEIINISLSQTLGRTLVTSLTTLLVLIALFYFGGELIHNFAVALIAGVAVGTYSSIYVAANVLLAMNITQEDLMLPVKEGAEFDEVP